MSPWIEIDQSRIDMFTDATGDHQWIHVHPERAKNSPFGETIPIDACPGSLRPAGAAGTAGTAQAANGPPTDDQKGLTAFRRSGLLPALTW